MKVFFFFNVVNRHGVEDLGLSEYIYISLKFLLFISDICKCLREVLTVPLPTFALCSCLETSVVKMGRGMLYFVVDRCISEVLRHLGRQ